MPVVTPFDIWLALWIEGVIIPTMGACGRAIDNLIQNKVLR